MCVISNINKTAYFYTACAVHVTIFSTGGEIPPGFEFYIVTHSSRPFLSALALPNIFDDTVKLPLSRSYPRHWKSNHTQQPKKDPIIEFACVLKIFFHGQKLWI